MWFTICSWLNTNMMETRQILETSELDGFEKVRSSWSLAGFTVWECGRVGEEWKVRELGC